MLSLVLLIASSVTAAVLPEKINNIQDDNSIDDCTLRSKSGLGNDINQNIPSCVPDNTLNYSCRCTKNTLTNANGSNVAGNVTIGNTSLSTSATGHEGDTTSEE